jgi:hypothetical protein
MPEPTEPAWGSSPPPSSSESTSGDTAGARASYGLVQLRGIPDGAAIDLDGRFWLTARDLDERWLALPKGEHTLSVRVGENDPIVRQVDVRSGKTQVVRF